MVLPHEPDDGEAQNVGQDPGPESGERAGELQVGRWVLKLRQADPEYQQCDSEREHCVRERLEARLVQRSPSGISAPSCSSSQRLRSIPPPKPVNSPRDPTTRWQGTMMGIGLAPLAAPTARDALGSPRRRASSP